MANLSQFTLPVFNETTGKIEMKTFNIAGGGGAGSPEGIGIGYGVCSTAYATTAKTAVFEGYNLKRTVLLLLSL